MTTDSLSYNTCPSYCTSLVSRLTSAIRGSNLYHFNTFLFDSPRADERVVVAHLWRVDVAPCICSFMPLLIDSLSHTHLLCFSLLWLAVCRGPCGLVLRSR